MACVKQQTARHPPRAMPRQAGEPASPPDLR